MLGVNCAGLECKAGAHRAHLSFGVQPCQGGNPCFTSRCWHDVKVSAQHETLKILSHANAGPPQAKACPNLLKTPPRHAAEK